jgi:hypothetical protein
MKNSMIVKTLAAVIVGSIISTTVHAQAGTDSTTSITKPQFTVPAKDSLLLPAVQAAREARVSSEPVQGLELLEKMGMYSIPLHVYSVKKSTDEDIKHLQNIGFQLSKISGTRFDGEFRPLGDTRISMRSPDDASASFEIDIITGSFLFNAGLNNYRKERSSEGLPDEGATESLALRVLDELGLKVDNAELKLAHIGGLNMGVTDGTGGTKIFEKFKTVRFSRVLDGLPVDGDTRILMQFGEESALSSVVYQWPQVESARRLSTKELRDSKEMRDSATKELLSFAKKAVSSRLTQVDLVLYDDGQGTIEPAYHVVLERQMDFGDLEPTMIPYDFYLPVTSEPTAIFPYMEIAAVFPKGGESEERLKNSNDE